MGCNVAAAPKPGWTRSPTGNDGFAKFDLGGHAPCLISRETFVQDAGFASPQGSGFAGVGLIWVVDKVNAG